MVFIGVSGNHNVQLRNAQRPEIRYDIVTVAGVAAVDEHGFTVTAHQGGISLSHIEKVYFKSRVFQRLPGRRRRRLRFRRRSAAGGQEQNSDPQKSNPAFFHFLTCVSFFSLYHKLREKDSPRGNKKHHHKKNTAQGGTAMEVLLSFYNFLFCLRFYYTQSVEISKPIFYNIKIRKTYA